MSWSKHRRERNQSRATSAGLSLADLGIESWSPSQVRTLQRRVGSKADGWMGPKTIAAFLAMRDAPAETCIKAPPTEEVPPTEEIMIDRETYRSKHGKRRSRNVKNIVLHDSVTRSARSTFNVLEKKGYSTHYIIGEDGQIFECLDPAKERGIHAAKYNTTSVGIDVVSMVGRKGLRKDRDAERMKRLRRVAYSPRGRYKDVVDYTPAQKASLSYLTAHLCERFSIPYRVPAGPYDYGAKVDGISPRYAGIVAHGQVSERRWDGGVGILTVMEAGATVKEP